jgi:hypothetical protein
MALNIYRRHGSTRFDILTRCGSRISRELQAGLKSWQIASDRY